MPVPYYPTVPVLPRSLLVGSAPEWAVALLAVLGLSALAAGVTSVIVTLVPDSPLADMLPFGMGVGVLVALPLHLLTEPTGAVLATGTVAVAAVLLGVFGGRALLHAGSRIWDVYSETDDTTDRLGILYGLLILAVGSVAVAGILAPTAGVALTVVTDTLASSPVFVVLLAITGLSSLVLAPLLVVEPG